MLVVVVGTMASCKVVCCHFLSLSSCFLLFCHHDCLGMIVGHSLVVVVVLLLSVKPLYSGRSSKSCRVISSSLVGCNAVLELCSHCQHLIDYTSSTWFGPIHTVDVPCMHCCVCRDIHDSNSTVCRSNGMLDAHFKSSVIFSLCTIVVGWPVFLLLWV